MPTREINRRLEQRSLKTQQRRNVEVDVVLGDLVHRTIGKPTIDGPGASGVRAPDSLERR
jgi:hypothetical protein